MPSLKKLYTRKEIDEIRQKLIDNHGDMCSICSKPGSSFKKRLSVDHNHKSNRIRGLLCYRCNKFMVGRQTIETCREVLEYLMKYDLEEK
jgi:Recombination endonuclease VII